MKTLSIEEFTQLLKLEEFCFVYTTSATTLNTSVYLNDLKLDFVVTYEIHVEGYSSATVTNPEEAEIDFENKEHSEIELSRNGEPIELTEDELEAIDETLAKLLY